MKRLLPDSLAARFGLASAGMAAAAVLLVALASGWLIERQQAAADERMAIRERQFHASNVGSTLRALSSRMSEVAGSTILATGLVDSAGKETYLAPFLNGIRQVNGIPVQLLFTDFEGKEISSNAGAHFDADQLRWLRERLALGKAAADILPSARGDELLAVEPLRYDRTLTPEGAVLYKIALRDIVLDPGLLLAWGPSPPGPAQPRVQVDAPAVFQHLAFRVTGSSQRASPAAASRPEFLAMAALAVLVFGALFLAGWRLARLLTRDLSQLEAFSTEVVSAEGGDRRAPEGGSTEVASLAQSINLMLERLREQHQVMREEGEKLANLAQALQAADRRKDEFLAMLAHELRNPLAPISSGAELLRLAAADDPKVQRTTEIIGRQVRHMTNIVDDLLEVSRVTRGLVTLQRQPLEAGTVLAAAADQVRGLAERKRQELRLERPEGELWVDADFGRLVQVASNLLQNACKYTQEGGRILACVRADAAEVVLEVQDNGSGIPAEFLPEIFGLFTQGPRASDRSDGGLGLGLALVKRLVELHGGTVQAASAGLGQGSVFTVRLPRISAASAPLLPQETGSAQLPEPLSVMVVDDNVDAAQTLAALLELEGHEVVLAYEGAGALERAASRGFDAFILDIGLPGMDGMELARRLRSAPAHCGALLVALTGYGQATDRRLTAEAGFDHHLVKPVEAQELHEVLLQAAARKRSRGAARAQALA